MATRKKAEAPVTDTTTTEAATSTPRTLEEKLAAAKALVAKYEREIASEAIKNDIQPGDKVTFNYGRGDKARVLSGAVVATKMIEEGTLKGLNLLVAEGEGFDATSYKVHVRDLLTNETADARRAEEGDEAPEAAGEADPLDSAE